MKKGDICILCDKFLRTKKNDFEKRLSCYKCYGKFRYSNNKIMELYPKKSFMYLHKSDIVNFGKFKGMTFNKLLDQKSYCHWLIRSWNSEKDNRLIKYIKYIYI